jgi:hypothetical protein
VTLSYLHPSKLRRRRSWRAEAGFTLTELMVAVTGGLFVSIIVFSISKNSARFYQSETRVGEATLGGIVGFERLRADIARAGFLSTPNILVDRDVCGGPPAPGFPTLLATLSAVQVVQDATTLPNNTNLQQDRILLAGSYSSNDYFAMRSFDLVAGNYDVSLDPASGAMVRLGYDSTNAAAAAAALGPVFLPGRAVRILDRSDKQYYGIINGINVQNPAQPIVQLALAPAIQQQGNNTLCGIDQCTGCVINVVNFIQYDVRRLQGTGYDPLYDNTAAFDGTRVELVRTELNPATDLATGAPLAGTAPELVAQYAVDLKFGLIVDGRNAAGDPPVLSAIPLDTAAVATAPPGRIRSVRVRLSVRTRDADRDVDITGGDQAALDLSPGLYRVGLGTDGTGPFARVRTLQADVMLNNTAGFRW